MADSFMTSPREPVSVSFPFPGITVVSITSVVPPTCVQASPFTEPISEIFSLSLIK